MCLLPAASARGPRSKTSRPWQPCSNLLSLMTVSFSAASGGLLQLSAVFGDAEEIALLHDQEIRAIDLHLGPRPFAEQDPVADLHIVRDQLALLIPRAGTRSDDLAFLGLLLCGVGNDDAAGGLLLGIDAAHEHAVVQRTEMHAHPP